MDHSDFYAFSCEGSVGAQCGGGACPDRSDDILYEGEYKRTIDQMEKSIRGVAWKPETNPIARGIWRRYMHFLTHQDNYTLFNTDFYPQLAGVDQDETWDLWKFVMSEFKDRVSLVNALPPAPASSFPKWYYRWMMGSMVFERAPTTAKDRRAGKYVQNREIGIRFFAPTPLCNLETQLSQIREAKVCEEREARMLYLSVHALCDAANDVALEQLLKLCYESCMEQSDCLASETKRSRFVRRLIQVGYLRSGESRNCQKHHNSESCIFPLSEKAQHVDREPATELLTKWLSSDSSQASKWLRLIAEMQLGLKKPSSSFPPPPALLVSEEEKKTVGRRRFKNIAGPLGLDLWGGTGAVTADMFLNEDGLMDFYQQTALQWPRGARSAVMKKNLRNGSFEDVSRKTKLIQGPSGNIGRQADFDNDGDLDLFNGRGGWMPFFLLPNSLYENKGGYFEEITRRAGDMTGEKGTHSAAWADFDLDGFLDLFVAAEQNPCELFRNNGDKTFTDVAQKLGVADCGWVKGVAWGYLNNDSYPDLVVSSIAGPNQIYINENGQRFRDVAEPGTGPRFSQPVAVVDLNNDGLDDIVFGAHRPPDPGELYSIYFEEPWEEKHVLESRGLSEDTGLTRVLLNSGNDTFQDVSLSTPRRLLQSGVMAMNFGDVDNDGFVDFYLGTGWPDLRGLMPNLMLRNLGNGSFEDITFSAGLGHLQKGHGICFLDVQNDGHLDIAASMGGAMTGDLFADALYLNPGDSENNWIKVSLVGSKANRLGQGARLVVETTHNQTVYTVVGNTASFGANPVKIHHVGLGSGDLAEIHVYWPHRDHLEPQTFKSLPTNAWIELEEATGAWRQKALATYAIDADALIENHESSHHTPTKGGGGGGGGGHCH
ncbi:hypothetical protein CTAYLR_002463 [Chrysophaeum taylorii]|uniref:ASPIC/UnbV domain-containing protein n=1 Tax=Chrysophaeum taylorii TaxID=2483200 RepID=A0AAD7UNH9_9STRA|nr:hypothetical protein CTAYLR_002463 [Chrysophaeum taylorii]